MSVQIKRMYLDFVARGYTTATDNIAIVSGSCELPVGSPPVTYALWEKRKAFTLRCYLSLQGEDNPAVSSQCSPDAAPTGTEQTTYRYEWAFGITLIEGFYWNWMKELPDEGAWAIHLVLEPEPFADGPEAVPIAAILSTLHPSRNTKSIGEQALPVVLKTTADAAKSGASVFPLLNYLSSGLTLGSNVLASYTDKQKNWFLYQFLDEKLKCPVVEWRINKRVLIEYGPLIRGTLFLAFHNAAKSKPGKVRLTLRPQIRYMHKDEISYIVPTHKIDPDEQVFIDVHPGDGGQPPS